MKQNAFEILRRVSKDAASATYPSAAPRGLLLGSHATDETAFNLAQSGNFLGHLTRDVVVGGPTLTDRVFGRTSATPVGVEYPFAAGDQVTVVKAQEIEAEGSDLLMFSGAGDMTSVAVGNLLSAKNGKLQIQQNGEVALYVVTAVLTAAGDLYDPDNNDLRIRAEALV